MLFSPEVFSLFSLYELPSRRVRPGVPPPVPPAGLLGLVPIAPAFGPLTLPCVWLIEVECPLVDEISRLMVRDPSNSTSYTFGLISVVCFAVR